MISKTVDKFRSFTHFILIPNTFFRRSRGVGILDDKTANSILHLEVLERLRTALGIDRMGLDGVSKTIPCIGRKLRRFRR